jgi:hypothetical protein
MTVALADAMKARPRLEQLTAEALEERTELEKRERKAYGKSSRDTPLHPEEWKDLQPELERAVKMHMDRTTALANLDATIARLKSPDEESIRLDIGAHHLLGE